MNWYEAVVDAEYFLMLVELGVAVDDCGWDGLCGLDWFGEEGAWVEEPLQGSDGLA